MNYVEWLRVRNLLRNVAIVLGILVVLAIVLRVSVSRYMSPDAWIGHFESHPGVKVSQSTLPDGTKRTIVDDPAEQTRAVIDDHGYTGKHIVVTQPSKHSMKEKTRVSVGSMHVYESHNGTVETTVIDTNGAVPMIYYMTLADVIALIVATILAAPFAREVDGHLEIALTKPVSRERYAIGTIVADMAGILGASVLTIVAFYLCQLLFESARLDFSGINAEAIAMGVAAPLAWYALLCAATTLAEPLLRSRSRLCLARVDSHRRTNLDSSEQHRGALHPRRCLGYLANQSAQLCFSYDARLSRCSRRAGHRDLWTAACGRYTLLRCLRRDCDLAVAAGGGLIVEILGTSFTISLGSWRFRLAVAIEDTDDVPKQKMRPPHRLRVVPEDEYVRTVRVRSRCESPDART